MIIDYYYAILDWFISLPVLITLPIRTDIDQCAGSSAPRPWRCFLLTCHADDSGIVITNLPYSGVNDLLLLCVYCGIIDVQGGPIDVITMTLFGSYWHWLPCCRWTFTDGSDKQANLTIVVDLCSIGIVARPAVISGDIYCERILPLLLNILIDGHWPGGGWSTTWDPYRRWAWTTASHACNIAPQHELKHFALTCLALHIVIYSEPVHCYSCYWYSSLLIRITTFHCDYCWCLRPSRYYRVLFWWRCCCSVVSLFGDWCILIFT